MRVRVMAASWEDNGLRLRLLRVRMLAAAASCEDNGLQELLVLRPLMLVRLELLRLWGREAAEEAIERLL